MDTGDAQQLDKPQMPWQDAFTAAGGITEMTETIPKKGEFLDGKLWFHRVNSTITVGLTDSAIEEIGSVEAIDFPGEGESFESGSVILSVDGTHGKLDVLAPADGTVQEINEILNDEPDMIAED